MSTSSIPTPRIREFLPQEFKITVWSKLKPYYNELLKRPILSLSELERWMLDESELDALFEEELHRRYFSKLANKNDARANDAYEYILHGIGNHIKEAKHQLRLRLVNEALLDQLDLQRFGTYIRSAKLQSEIFRKENNFLFSEIDLLLEAHLDTKKPELVLEKIVELRTRISNNAGFDNYRDFRFKELERCDYTSEDCHELHESISDLVVPVISKLNQTELSAFAKTSEYNCQHHLSKDKLTDTAIHFLNSIHPEFGACLKKMQLVDHINLTDGEPGRQESLSSPLTGVSYIRGNYNGCLPELFEFFQSCGLAIQQMLSTQHSVSRHRYASSEMQLLVGKFFELLIIEKAAHLFTEKDQTQKIKRYLITRSLFDLSKAAMLDRFEHWLYKHPDHTVAQRQHALLYINSRFNTISDNKGQTDSLLSQNDYYTIFDQPFQAIETAIAQIGAFALWKNYQSAPTQTLESLIKMLKEGGRLSLKEAYQFAGIPLDFSNGHISELMTFVRTEIQG